MNCCPQILGMSLPRNGAVPFGGFTKHSLNKPSIGGAPPVCQAPVRCWQKGEQIRHGALSLGLQSREETGLDQALTLVKVR